MAPNVMGGASLLLTTVTETYERVSMHGVRRSLLRAQARAVGLPVLEVPIPPQCTNAVYEARMAEAMKRLKAQGVQSVAFGDLFLVDVRVPGASAAPGRDGGAAYAVGAEQGTCRSGVPTSRRARDRNVR